MFVKSVCKSKLLPKLKNAKKYIYNEKRILNYNYLRIKRVHNLPSHLSYVSTLPDITQKLKRDTDELKH